MVENDNQQSPSASTHQQRAIVAIPTNIPLPAKLEGTGNLAANWKVLIRAWKKNMKWWVDSKILANQMKKKK